MIIEETEEGLQVAHDALLVRKECQYGLFGGRGRLKLPVDEVEGSRSL